MHWQTGRVDLDSRLHRSSQRFPIPTPLRFPAIARFSLIHYLVLRRRRAGNRLCDVDASLCIDAIDGAENALFDEESGPLHLAAMRFLCKFGAISEQNSERVWPLIDEGIQCWHGDLEFQDMLNSLVDFSTGHLSEPVKSELAERMLFDSKNGRGALRRKATTIVENLS